MYPDLAPIPTESSSDRASASSFRPSVPLIRISRPTGQPIPYPRLPPSQSVPSRIPRPSPFFPVIIFLVLPLISTTPTPSSAAQQLLVQMPS